MKKKLLETLEAQLYTPPTLDVSTDNMVNEWGGIPYAPLSHLLSWLRYLTMVNQTHHWMSRGQVSYGDHLLFQRIYEGINEQVDALAEKIVGLNNEAGVHLGLQTSQIDRLNRAYQAHTVPNDDELARKSLTLEFNFLKVIEYVRDLLDREGKLTYGLDNMLAGFADVHEGYVYLLKQRCVK